MNPMSCEEIVGQIVMRKKSEVVLFYIYISWLSFIVDVCFMLFTPFLPLELEKKGYDPSMMGSVIAVYHLAQIVTGLNLSKLSKQIKRRNLFMASFFVLGSSMVVFSLLMVLNLSAGLFYAVIFLMRML